MANLSRRQTLIGLGAAAGGTGAIVASGAFSSVEAQRDVEIQTAGDGAALLQLEPAGTGTIVQQDSPDGIIGFDIEASGASGVNQNARTTFRPALRVTNNGEETVGFYVESETNIGSGSGDVLDFQNNDDGESIVNSTNAIDVTSGGSVLVDLVIDLIDQPASALESIEDVTLVAEQEAANS